MSTNYTTSGVITLRGLTPDDERVDQIARDVAHTHRVTVEVLDDPTADGDVQVRVHSDDTDRMAAAISVLCSH
jgi:hypothetical protein